MHTHAPTAPLHLVTSLAVLLVPLGACGGDGPSPATTSMSASVSDAGATQDDPCQRADDDPCVARAGLVGTWQCVTEELTVAENGALTLVSTDGRRASGCITCDGAFYARAAAEGDAAALAVVEGSLQTEGDEVASSDWSYCNGLDDVDACARAPEKGTKSARCYLAPPATTDGAASAPDPLASAPGTTVELVVSQAWTATGIELSAGDEVSIVASGEILWYTGVCDTCTSTPVGGGCPVDEGNFVLGGVRCWSLLAKIGEQGAPVYVGDRGSFTASEAGELLLGVNDDNFVDNTGTWTAAVDVKPGT
jgi:hypothetical protein